MAALDSSGASRGSAQTPKAVGPTAETALAGDIGGTNARLALVAIEDGALRLLRVQRYESRAYPGLAPIIQQFFQEVGHAPSRACFAIACPVVGDDCRASNLPWTVNARALASEIGIPATSIINDFDAVGHGLGQLFPSDQTTLQVGERVEHGPLALIGAGTGLGEGYLVWDNDRYRVHSSEGGHADFAARNSLQAGLAEFLRAEYGHASYERVLSGRGIADLYRYLVAARVAPESPAVRAELEAAASPAAVITGHALAATDALCTRAVAIFLDVLAAQAGNLALTVAATGGVYLAGGIAPRLIPLMQDGVFAQRFREKGRMADLLSRVPIRVITNTDVGLLGAAAVAVGRSG